MTTPPRPPPQPPPPVAAGLDDPALPLAVATVLVTATSAAAGIEIIKAAFALSAGATAALTAVLADVMSAPPALTGIIGAASEQTSRLNAARRAQYVLAATRRVLGAVRDARAQGNPVMAAARAQLALERRYYAQHTAAMWNRARAAGMTDLAAAAHGRLLGWNTVRDAATSAECRAADGKNFYATAMPDIGFPGSVHPNCRCFPGPAHPGAALLPARGRLAAAA
jgi:hypothetical protein